MATKFIPAKHFTRGRLKRIRLIVIHDMESPEKGTTAEAVARYFQTTTRSASAHYCIDADSVVQCVRDSDTAWAAKGANSDGLHLEHAGYASQDRRQWTDTYSAAMLARSAKLTAVKARQYGIPIRHLGPTQVRAGAKGICGHADVTKAYPPGSGHTDPGPHFPWDAYLTMVQAETDALAGRPWTRGRVGKAAAGMGLAAAVLAGVTATKDPAPAPKPPAASPSKTATSTAKPSPAGPTVTVRATSTVTKTRTATATRTVTRNVPVTATRTVRPPAREYVIVRTGDTLAAIARAQGTTVPALRRLNPSAVPELLQPGTLIRTA